MISNGTEKKYLKHILMYFWEKQRRNVDVSHSSKKNWSENNYS